MSSRSNYYAQYPNQRPHGILPSSLYPTISPSPAPTLSLLPLPLPSPSPSFPYHASSWPIPVPVHVPSSSPRERPQHRSKRNLSITVPPPPRLATLQAYQPLDSSLGLSHSSVYLRSPFVLQGTVSPSRPIPYLAITPASEEENFGVAYDGIPREWEWEWGRAGEGDR
ncbi:hypothetical protein EHS25_007873 [Saitozyma podzolica]|uniref:Uncharacterized protein n=1 Tax=Saitozyma podzolica TaxID=1890683 RepID=A0A427YR21_9TREE|nr:hypothetical protein EHS25_007873 [Saitozyma podzolica]